MMLEKYSKSTQRNAARKAIRVTNSISASISYAAPLVMRYTLVAGIKISLMVNLDDCFHTVINIIY